MTPTKIISTPAEALIKQEILRWGPLNFSQFMELALYHPQYGYYCRTASPRGRKGDYFTSLQTSSLFPQIWAEVIIQLRQQLDSSQFSLIEFGSGGGELLEGILTTLQRKKELKGLRVISIERSAAARRVIQKRLSRFPKCDVVATLDEADTFGGLEGCVLSNEFFDALPFHRYRFRKGVWNEIFIQLEGESLVEIEKPLAETPRCLQTTEEPWQDTQEVEIRPLIQNWYQELSQYFERGTIVSVDYGAPRQQLYSSRRMKGTWRCFYQHQLIDKALVNIGRQDITSHVDFTQMAEVGRQAGFDPALFSSQGLFLACSAPQVIDQFLKDGADEEKLKRAGAVQQLVHPDAMGEAFWVFIQTKRTNLPEKLSGIPNRVRRL